jgi:hypothetical protein
MSRLRALVALIVACNYFSFRVEIFDVEAESQHHDLPSGAAIAGSTVTWETFDKDNASQAFTIEVLNGEERLFFVPALAPAALQDLQPFQPIRDKSPPPAFRTLI